MVIFNFYTVDNPNKFNIFFFVVDDVVRYAANIRNRVSE